MRTVTVASEILLTDVARLLAEGNSIVMKAKGNSMLPFIRGGRDSVVLQKEEAVHRGDIVLAEIVPRRFVLHRVIRIEGDVVTLMGDGNLWGTELCRSRSICGHVVAIISKGEKIDCNKPGEQRKAKIWQGLLPLRRYMLAIYHRLYPDI